MTCGCKERREWVVNKLDEGKDWFSRWLYAQRIQDQDLIEKLRKEQDLEPLNEEPKNG